MISGMYLGASELGAAYIGDVQIYPTTITGLTITSSITARKSGGTFNITVRSESAYNIVADNWITLSAASGDSGTTRITVTIGANETGNDRTGGITATTTDNVYTDTCIVEQSAASLPAGFLINYNAKDYDSTTHSIPANSEQTLQSACTFQIRAGSPAEPTVYSDHIYIPSGWSAWFTFANNGSNPFNRDSNNKAMTIIYRVGNIPSGSNILANRTGGYNYMARYGILHTSSSTFLQVNPPVQSDQTCIIRIQDNGSSERWFDGYKSTAYASASSISYGSICSGAAIFQGYANGNSELNYGDFYWIYVAMRALTDAEIQEVIDYNNNL